MIIVLSLLLIFKIFWCKWIIVKIGCKIIVYIILYGFFWFWRGGCIFENDDKLYNIYYLIDVFDICLIK